MTALGAADGRSRAASLLRPVVEMLDAHVMGPRLRAAVGAPGRGGCHVLDAKYEPGVRCTVLYRSGDLLVRGDLEEQGSDPRDGDASRPHVAPGVRLSCFPADPDLPGLVAAADPARLRDALRDALPGAASALACRTDLVRYRPAKRATLAVRLRGATGRTASLPERLIVKSYHDARKAAAVAEEAVLLGASVDPAGPLRLAPVRAHVPDLALVVQEHVDGVRLDSVLQPPGGAVPAALQRAAVALAELHSRPVVSSRTRSVDAELARFGIRARRVADVDPAAGAALGELASRLAATARDVPRGEVALVHGDCKPSQFLLRGDGRVVLLDLDSCGRADPAGDVGTFLATLRQQTVRQVLARRASPAAAQERAALAEVFLGAYTAAAGAESDGGLRRRIRWYQAVALERKALRSFARAPRSPLTRALVDAGHACLDRLDGLR